MKIREYYIKNGEIHFIVNDSEIIFKYDSDIFVRAV